ncbi:uncharacterized protein LOC101161317 [Oryzias latipes]|uniref:uncharacterized protein LOC101161317 n=1 Tax=Oryzias latipes TaxID=8090 RepID=UPI0002A493CA|nr:uncharacterized protein LOC101161317 [Oryzias latipes]
MELRCLPIESPTTASTCSMDPLYDNCPPFAQRVKPREKGMQSGISCASVSRFQGTGSPPPGVVPALAGVHLLVCGGEAGALPESCSSSCRRGLGRPAWKEEPRGGREKPKEQGRGWGAKDGVFLKQSPCPSLSEEHRSALSLYDNLLDADTTGSHRPLFDVETSVQDWQEHMYQAWAPEEMQELMQAEAEKEDKNKWSCDLIQNPGKGEQQQDPELDSGSCMSAQQDSKLDLENSPKLLQTKLQVKWPPAADQHHRLPSLSPKEPPPPPLADPSASALRSLLTSLQQQILRQQEDYEAQILSLEQRNEELQLEVVHLKTNLSQQRQWYQVVQAKIEESEKARAAAELRNATLQREMEQFFDTFGELNNEAKKTEYIVKSF